MVVVFGGVWNGDLLGSGNKDNTTICVVPLDSGHERSGIDRIRVVSRDEWEHRNRRHQFIVHQKNADVKQTQ